MIHVDSKSLGGVITSLLLSIFGAMTLQHWAFIVAIASGLLTSAYTIYKWRKDLKK
jgi:4-hydroxybenzoate polyprenyltransferase